MDLKPEATHIGTLSMFRAKIPAETLTLDILRLELRPPYDP